jgi:hypothetical protein
MVTAGVQLNFLGTTTQGTSIIQTCGSKETPEICTRLVTNECKALSRGPRGITSVQLCRNLEKTTIICWSVHYHVS